jgi:hypothetical protein
MIGQSAASGRKEDMALTSEDKQAFLDLHIPHRLCLLTTFRDRQVWFKERIGEADCDLLRVSKDSALISIRLFSEFLGLQLNGHKPRRLEERSGAGRHDDILVDMLGGKRVLLADLSPAELPVIEGLLRRASKELAHLTSDYSDHNEFNTAGAFTVGIDAIERLLQTHLYEPLLHPFPNLVSEKLICNNEWQFMDGPGT